MMIQRQAIFRGTLKQGQEAAMRAYVMDKLLPLWRAFDRAQNVQVFFQLERDPNGPSHPLILAITYADAAGMAQGLASDARYESRDLLPAFYDSYFEDVTLLHYVMDVVQ